MEKQNFLAKKSMTENGLERGGESGIVNKYSQMLKAQAYESLINWINKLDS